MPSGRAAPWRARHAPYCKGFQFTAQRRVSLKIAMIGGAGFIGSHLAKELSEHEVTAIDSLMVNNLYSQEPWGEVRSRILRERVDNLACRLIIADARNYNILSPLCKAINPDVIIHLAAISHQGKARKEPHTTFDHSMRTLENALDISLSLKIRRFVYFSSSTVYGDWPSSGVVDESMECHPKGIYSSLKLAGEMLVKSYAKEYGLEYTIIRPSALYGPGCVSGRVIEMFIEQAKSGESLNATDEMLDFTYVSDLVRGVRLAIESPLAANQTYNLTYGEGRPVIDAANLVAKRYNVNVNCIQRDDGFANRGTLSIERARSQIGYAPGVSLEAGVPEYMRWRDGF